MNNYPLVTILIPTYNQGKYIKRAIESALKQDYENIEIIVSDDASSDNTETVIQKYLNINNFYYYKNSLRLGRVKNYYNLLYNLAKGDWVVNLDGDDFFTDYGFISKCINIINNHKDKQICFLQAGHTISFENNDLNVIKVPEIKNKYEIIDGKDYLKNFIKINHFSHLATFYNRSKAIETGFYLNDILSTDIESILKLALTGKVVLIKETVGVWVQHNENISSKSGLNKLIENLQWIDNIYKYLIDKTGEKKNWDKWKKDNYKIQLTGIFFKEAKQTKNISDKIELLKYFWENYRFLYFYPVFIKKTIESFLK